MSTTIFAKQLNYVNLLTEAYTLLLGPTKSPDVVLGCSFDMNDKNSPCAKGKLLKNAAQISDDDNLETESDPQSYTYEISKVETVEEEMFKFSLHFSGSYGIVSGSLDYTKTQKDFEQNDIFYLEFESVSNATTIQDVNAILFRSDPKAELIVDYKERFERFINDYGSHYTRTIYYGSRLVIRAKSKIKNSELSESLNIALKAIGSGFTAGAEFESIHTKTLKDKNVEISISLMGKLISPSDSNKNPIFRVIDFATLFRLIEDIRTGEARIISCPIKCEIETFKYRLDDYPNCKELFTKPVKSVIVDSPYGVPSGTILPWIPKLENCRIDDATGEVIEIFPPEGWALCNENIVDFNLTGRFLRGVANFKDIKGTGGKDIHSHRVTTREPITTNRGNTYAHGLDGGGSDFHPTVSIDLESDTSDGRPPFFNVIYIIKM